MPKVKNLNTSLVISIVLVVALSPSVRASGTYENGDGSPGNPFQINTAAQMDEIGQHSEDWDKCFILTADIDLSAYTGTSFNIIGADWNNPFTGVFDGKDHTISNFTYTTTGTDYIGLFGYIETDGQIKNLGLVNANVNAGTGIVVGALVGGNIAGPISNCYATGTVSGDYYVGGLVGYNFGNISNCYATGTVTGDSFHVGGLVGINEWGGSISNCYATGTVSGDYGVGGLMGCNFENISNCYSTGDVSGDGMVGGLVGENSHGTISNCYAAGAVSGTSNLGGLVGKEIGSTSYTSCFWDSDVNPDVNGIGNATDPNVIGETTATMKTQSTFTSAGWDFVGESANGTEDIWSICEAVDYPKLTWQFVIGDFDSDDDVDFADFAALAIHWLATDSSFWCGGGGTDLTDDGDVDFYDLKKFFDNWLAGTIL